MKSLLLGLVLVGIACSLPIAENPIDNGCAVVRASVTEISAPDSTTPPSSQPILGNLPDQQSISSSLTSIPTTTTVSSSSAARTGANSAEQSDSNGIASFPINGDHLSAPEAPDYVPLESTTFFRPENGIFNCTAFNDFVNLRKNSKLSSKFFKVVPGVYSYMPGPKRSPNDDPNNIPGTGIQLYSLSPGWTIDLRGVTLVVQITPENKLQHPDQMIYINQSENLTILGGIIWIDQGEQWSQARVTSITSTPGLTNGDKTATFEVEQGFDTSIWSTVDQRNQGCVDTSNTTHFARPDCNFWYVSQYDFSRLATARTYTAVVGPRSGIQVGYTIYTKVGPNTATTIASENNGGLHVHGMTSNGNYMQYGLNGKVPAIFENVWAVNYPPRPGYAPRVNGPTLSQGHIGDFNFNADGEAAPIYKNSVWMTTGNQNDLQSMSNETLPTH